MRKIKNIALFVLFIFIGSYIIGMEYREELSDLFLVYAEKTADKLYKIIEGGELI